MKRVLCCLFAAVMALGLCGCGKQEKSRTVYAMDTVMEFRVYGKETEAALTALERRVQELENLLSRTKETSEVSALNRAGGQETEVSGETWNLLAAAREAAQVTGGAFDVTIAPVASAWGFTEESFRVPSQEELDTLLPLVGAGNISLARNGDTYLAALQPGQAVDLGGIAKGYASDCMADVLLECGIESGYAALGGNVLAWGAKPDGSDWRIGVKDPNNTAALTGVLALQNAYAVTSGGYERCFTENGKTYHHIIDPATGYPAESDLVSVTIVMDWNGEKLGGKSGNGTLCDVLSTALFVMGEEAALDFWRSGVYDFDAVLVTADGRVLTTDGLAQRFTPTEGSGYSYETVS